MHSAYDRQARITSSCKTLSSYFGERRIFSRTLTKTAHLTHKSVGARGAPPLLAFQPRHSWPRLVNGDGRLASPEAVAPDTASVGVACKRAYEQRMRLGVVQFVLYCQSRGLVAKWASSIRKTLSAFKKSHLLTLSEK